MMLAGRWMLGLPGLLATVLLLAACAGGNAERTSGGNKNEAQAGPDIITSSDEPEYRRRARIRLELAVGYFEQGQTTVALDEVKRSLAADPQFADAFNVRGLIYLRLSEFPLAEDSFRRALAINPGDGGTLHNLGWMQCQRGRYAESIQSFTQALGSPLYGDRAKTFMTKGLCEQRAGLSADAEASLLKAYEYDAGNPIVGYNLSDLLAKRGELTRAQFYLRRLNNGEFSNAETLWLGIKVERRLGDMQAMSQLSDQLRRRYGDSREARSLERGAFDE